MTTRDDQGESQCGAIHIPISPAGQRFALFALIFAILFAVMMIIVRPTNSLTTPASMFAAGVILLLLSGSSLARCVYLNFKRKSGVIVSDRGLEDLGTLFPFGDFAFTDVLDVRVAKKHTSLGDFEVVWVVVDLKNPTDCLEREPFLRKWLIRKWSMRKFGSPRAFQVGFLAMPSDRFVSLLRRKAGLE